MRAAFSGINTLKKQNKNICPTKFHGCGIVFLQIDGHHTLIHTKLRLIEYHHVVISSIEVQSTPVAYTNSKYSFNMFPIYSFEPKGES